MAVRRKQLIILTFPGRMTDAEMSELGQQMREHIGLPEDQVKIGIIENCSGATVLEYFEQVSPEEQAKARAVIDDVERQSAEFNRVLDERVRKEFDRRVAELERRLRP